MRQLIFTADTGLQSLVPDSYEAIRIERNSASARRLETLWALFSQSPPKSPCDLRSVLARAGSVVCCADPVFLLANMDRLVIQGSVNNLSGEEIDALNLAFAELLQDDVMHVELLPGGQGVLGGSQAEGSSRDEPSAYLKAELRELAASEPLPRNLLALEAEIQMLLYEHPVNVARERAGKALISSLWFWGSGPKHSEGPSELPYLLAADATLAGWWAQTAPRRRWADSLPDLLQSENDALISIESQEQWLLVQQFLQALPTRHARNTMIRVCDIGGEYRLLRRRRWWPF